MVFFTVGCFLHIQRSRSRSFIRYVLQRLFLQVPLLLRWASWALPAFFDLCNDIFECFQNKQSVSGMGTLAGQWWNRKWKVRFEAERKAFQSCKLFPVPTDSDTYLSLEVLPACNCDPWVCWSSDMVAKLKFKSIRVKKVVLGHYCCLWCVSQWSNVPLVTQDSCANVCFCWNICTL